jgi:hypothetical protein
MEEFLVNLGHGPERKNVQLKQPDTALFFAILLNKNELKIEKEI